MTVSLAHKPFPVTVPLPAPKPGTTRAPQPKKHYSRSHRTALLRFGLVFGLTMILAFVAVAWQAQILSARRRVQTLGTSIVSMEAELSVMQLEVARLSSTARIESEASLRLQMSKPTEAQIVKVSFANP